MESVKADAEDFREVFNASKIIYEAIIKNNLQVVYVMEALQALYASKASDLVSYEEYCKKLDEHKRALRHMWEGK